jgi:hypothetical protein
MHHRERAALPKCAQLVNFSTQGLRSHESFVTLFRINPACARRKVIFFTQ